MRSRTTADQTSSPFLDKLVSLWQHLVWLSHALRHITACVTASVLGSDSELCCTCPRELTADGNFSQAKAEGTLLPCCVNLCPPQPG